jgi:hypothetical protein
VGSDSEDDQGAEVPGSAQSRDERGGSGEVACETRCVADTVSCSRAAVQPHRLCLHGRELRTGCVPVRFIVLSLLSSACCLRRTHRYPHGPRPSSSSCSTKELGGLHAGNQQSEICFVQYYLYVLYHSRPAVANVAALAHRLACSELLLLRGCWKPNNVGTWARGQMLTPV